MSTTDLSQMPLNEALALTKHGLTEETLNALVAFTTQQWIDLNGINRALALKDAGIPLPESTSYADLAEQLDAALTSLDVEVKAVVIAAQVKVNVEEAPVNKFAHLLKQGAGSSGLDASALSPRIRPAFVTAASQAILAYVLSGTGVLEALMAPDFWQKMMIEDLGVRELIDAWLQKVEQGTYITSRSSRALFEGVMSLFGPKFDKFMKTVALFASQSTSLAMMGKQAIVDISADASAFAGLETHIPLLAEEISTNMIASRMPELAKRHIQMVADLMAILKNPVLQAYAGIVGASSLDEGAVMLLSKLLGPSIANKVRLALAYESFVAALAECPAVMEPDYLKVIGILAARLNSLFEIVQPNREVPAEKAIMPFRRTQDVVAPSIGFSLNLSIVWRR
jgi:hypothetical protein